MPVKIKPVRQLPLVSMRGISKRFQAVQANNHVDLDIYRGEIHALLGENGAGKSTLVKILFGFYRADQGETRINGKVVSVHSPRVALAHHIGMVFQDLNLIPAFSVAENIALFLPHLPAVLDPQEIIKKIDAVSKEYGLEINPKALISQLSIGEQQKVEILKLLVSDASLLILDEPTRVLAPHEVKKLFSVLENLRKKGYAIVLITHKMKEVLECADRITVLRDGRVAGTLLRKQATEHKLVALMFEKHLTKLSTQSPYARRNAGPVLQLQRVETRTENGSFGLKEIDLVVHAGEIVGVAGVSGNGQKELCDIVLGMERSSQGKKYLFGKDLTNRSVQSIRQSGVSFIPENPLAMASIPYMSVLENMSLTRTVSYSRLKGFSMDWGAVRRDVMTTAKRLGFSVNLDTMAKSLSGGYLQRMVILREIAHHPQLIIASYLTRGLDVQSAIAARQALLRARADGAGVLLISEDLEELFELSDHLVVLYEGKIVGRFKPSQTDIYLVGYLMTGSKGKYAKR